MGGVSSISEQENWSPAPDAALRLRVSRITIPKRAEGYVQRPGIIEQCQLLERRVVVLRACCGFGKTAVMNEICHREKARGVLVAWLRIDDGLTGALLLTYLAGSFSLGGLDLSRLRKRWRANGQTGGTNVRVGLLLRAIEEYGKPCVVALDEVERLMSVDAVAMVNRLLQRGPSNLHFVMAMRSRPQGLDYATQVLDGRGIVLNHEQLRFSKPEIASFFERPVSHDELNRAVERTEGWPAALRLHRETELDSMQSGLARHRRQQRAVHEALATRLVRGLSEEHRQLLLDLSIVDAIDPDVINNVLDGDQTGNIRALMSVLPGLVQPIDSTQPLLRLHPLVREVCGELFRRDHPSRFQLLHRRLADAFARQGELMAALRHAGEIGDEELCGELLKRVHGTALLFGSGIDAFLRASRFLSDKIVVAEPRLALMRCSAMAFNADLGGALALYKRVRRQTGNFNRDRRGGDDLALKVDSTLARWILSDVGCASPDDRRVEPLYRWLTGLAADDRVAAPQRASLCAVLCAFDQQRARFERSRQWKIRATALFSSDDPPRITEWIAFHRGTVAMAEGRIDDAIEAYSRNQRHLFADILLAELQIERSINPAVAWADASAHLARQRIAWGWFDVHAAAHGNALEAAFEKGGVEAVLSALDESLSYAKSQNLPALARLLCAQGVYWLVAGGRIEEAEQAWIEAALPESVDDHLDLERQSWREMEAVSCARIRLLSACGGFSGARELAERLREVAEARGLTRTLMRGLIEWMVLEYRASNRVGAAARLADFLRLFQTSDYGRALARNRRISRQVLKALLIGKQDRHMKDLAETVLRRLEGKAAGGTRQGESYTEREIAVLKNLALGQRDKEIARRLKLTESGVRYHLKNIYRKMGANNRGEAIRRARSKGIV